MTDQDGDLEPIAALLRQHFPLRGNDLIVELSGTSPVHDDGYGVWIKLRFSGADRAFEGSVLLIASGRFGDPRRDAFVHGWIEALAIVLRESVERISPASVDVRFPIDAGSGGTAASFRDDLLKGKWLGKHLPRERQTPSAAYEKAPAAYALPNGGLDLNALFLWIDRQVSVGWRDDEADQKVLAAVPEPVRVAWLLSVFEGAVYNGGIPGFLQKSAWIMGGCGDALRAIGALSLLAALNTGTGDDATGSLLESELRPRLAAYCAAHQDELIQ